MNRKKSNVGRFISLGKMPKNSLRNFAADLIWNSSTTWNSITKTRRERLFLKRGVRSEGKKENGKKI